MFVVSRFFSNTSLISNPSSHGKARWGLTRSFVLTSTPVHTLYVGHHFANPPYDVPARVFSRRKGKLKGAGGRWAQGANESVAEFVKREREQVSGFGGCLKGLHVYSCSADCFTAT